MKQNPICTVFRKTFRINRLISLQISRVFRTPRVVVHAPRETPTCCLSCFFFLLPTLSLPLLEPDSFLLRLLPPSPCFASPHHPGPRRTSPRGGFCSTRCQAHTPVAGFCNDDRDEGRRGRCNSGDVAFKLLGAST